MSEPLDPIAAGVASALKSLRTRAGLRGDRLIGNEPALDTLAGLQSVKELIATGERPERAIVRTVSAAVSALGPTYSIVADVSLGLELSAHDLPGSDLYANDLGRRRVALLKHWDRLHELRSAPSAGEAPTLRTLRLEIEIAALSAVAVALTSGDPALAPRALDVSGAATAGAGSIVLDGSSAGVVSGTAPRRGVISGQPGSARTDAHSDALPRLLRSSTPLLLGEFGRIARALRDSLLVDEKGQGWPHDLRPGSSPHTATATSFAIKTLLLLEGFLAPDLTPVVEQLRKRTKGGGHAAARSQVKPRPETTAVVLDTLHRIDGTVDFSIPFDAMKKGLADFERTRPFILSTVLETSAQLGCDPELTRSLTKDLLRARRPFGNLLLWPEKAEENLVSPVPSVAHTARAVWALAQARSARSSGQDLGQLDSEIEIAIQQAAAWLAEQQDLTAASESVDRQLPDGVELVYVRHFTAAWVVKALVSAGLPASHPAVSGAVARIWSEYSAPTALWSWSNGEVPVWMTLDAVEALRLAALATTIPSGGLGV
jgi:hypothetical protein